MTNITYSVNNVPIRLIDERWIHIVENHDDIAGYYFDVLETIANPKWIFEGDGDELWAVKLVSERKAILVIYKELEEDNMATTAAAVKEIFEALPHIKKVGAKTSMV
jgi:hypothetical protein